MAQCKLSPQDFVRDAFTPQIAVMCTPAAQRCCEKNNLDFTEVLQPFSNLSNDVSFKEPGGITITIKNLKLSFLDVNQKPPQTALARKLLNSSVSDALEPRTKIHETKNYQLEIPSSTPWYDNWRDIFLKVQYPSDHEFTKHFLSCLLVVSSTENEPVETIIQLAQNLNHLQNSNAQGSLPKWLSPGVLKYYVILHDALEGNVTKASESFESLKASYGASNCFLLRMNSRPPDAVSNDHLADPWSQFLVNKIGKNLEQNTPDASPDVKRTSLELAQEVNENRTLLLHPLSPELEDFIVDSELEKEEAATNDKSKWGHGVCLSPDDIEQIKAMVCEYTRSCLIPYVEKQVAMLSDAITTKKGMSKSIFTATKRWFSTPKANSSTIAANNLIYAPDSSELHIRKLGDLYFMFGIYGLAFEAYHTAKRDYYADQAWLYYSGALEMAALSAFMANEPSRKSYDYMEESITTYLTTCKMPQFATRATILSQECLKAKQLYGETAHQLIRMTSEDSDLRSALFLEQASYCFLRSNMLRKYAFHMVLAGHRFSKAGQKKHSFRCYRQAHQIYENVGWDLASDHIHYTVGKLANNLQKFEEAVKYLERLLSGESQQSALQQGVFLREYLTILDAKLKMDNSNENPILPAPELRNSDVTVLVGPTRPLSTPGKIPALGVTFNTPRDLVSEQRWHKLEEILLEESENPPLIFKPMVTLYTATIMENNQVMAIINEPIQVSVELENILQTTLVLKDIYLLWSYETDDGVITNDELNENVDKYIKTYVTKSLILQGNSQQSIVLSLTPLVTGDLTISAICYCLAPSSETDNLAVRGRKIFNMSTDTETVKPISVKLLPYAPCLQMTFSELSMDFLAGELQRISVDLQNTGSVPLKNIMIATSVPHLVSNCEMKSNQVEYTIDDGDSPQVKEKLAKKNHITSIPLVDGILESGQAISFHIWVKAPQIKGPSSVDLLTYYENVDSKNLPRYRLIRHSWNLTVQESISVDVSSQTSYNSKSAEHITLALKATNLNKIHYSISTEVTLLNIALFSDHWILTKDIVTPNFITLNSEQSAHILCKARREVKKESQYTNLSLNTDQSVSAHLQTAFETFARKSHSPLLNWFDEASSTKRDATLIIDWKALVYDAGARRIVNGLTCVPVLVNGGKKEKIEKYIGDIDINSPRVMNVEKNSKSPQKQLIYNILHPSCVMHDFKKKGCCLVTISLVLHSILEEQLQVVVSTVDGCSKPVIPQTRFMIQNQVNTKAMNNFSWITQGKVKRSLAPMETAALNLTFVADRPGTFDLGEHLKVFCGKMDQEQDRVLQFFDVPSTIIICNPDS